MSRSVIVSRKLLVALMFTLLSLVRLKAAFEGDYNESRWTIKPYAGDGAVDWLSDSVLIDSGYSGSGSVAQLDLTVTVTRSGTFYFNWTFYGGITSGYRLARLRNGSANTIVSRKDYAEGMETFTAAAGDIIGFRIAAPLDEFPAMAEIFSFFAPGQEPAILIQPSAVTTCAAGLAIFTVLATNAVDYQWQFKGQDILEETFDSLILRAYPPADTGTYRVIVRNPLGSVTSQSVPLSIRAAPSITVQPAPNTIRCAGQSVTFTAGASGSNLRWQWARDGIPIPAAVSSNLTIPILLPSDSGRYAATASNECGAALSAGAQLTVTSPPIITTQPQAQSPNRGELATFFATAAGTSPLQFQWRFNGANIPAATGPSLALTNVQDSQVGLYSVVVGNACGTTTSTSAALTLASQPVGIRIVRGKKQEVNIEVLADPGRQYVLEVSLDFVHWTPFQTNWLVVAGSPLFYDVADSGARYYRVRPAD